MDQPIACSLSAREYTARTDDMRELTRRALRSRRAIPGGARLTFEPGADTEHRLRELVAAEARCCPFLRLDLQAGERALVLDVTGPPEAEPIVAELLS